MSNLKLRQLAVMRTNAESLLVEALSSSTWERVNELNNLIRVIKQAQIDELVSENNRLIEALINNSDVTYAKRAS